MRFLPVLAVLYFTFAPFAGAAPGSSFLYNGVTAHRGDSGGFPENTMAAFESALALGVDWIEIDIFRSSDGVLVVTHDATTERVGDKNLAIAEHTLAELEAVDVAADFRKRSGLSAEACPPARMPTLQAVIERMIRQDLTRLSIQPKIDVVDEAIALIRELGAERWVGFNDGDLNKMRRVKELAPDIPVFWDRNADFPLAADLETAKQYGFESLVVHSSGLTAEKVRAIKAAGFEAGAWTVNDAPAMQVLLDMGLDRIYTDFPKRLLNLRSRE